MAQFGLTDKVKLVEGGENIYEVIGTDSGYYRLLCTDFKCKESLSFDVTCYSYGSEFWLSCENDHVLKLV